ncbi:SafA/ExsA family spore coat assembly protein [Bacillus badius]|uniref:SafA/ExsA family spore coat assembly protein n=1 Tax=Bacillus badius TaxID=1455 RepID=UPI0007B05929|nr:SafA/ExsA family spore coat assembly protein [Bacillus badius]KZN98702.1 hypothetical protein A4244_06200 [Bacillus badius]MED0666309.1 SafA/ExsA family spore coat assembly protein [Bacillus badius]OCS83640.1 hypothetical protein A6M11_06205 [Bacillus badius]OVE53073.1 hypothetical protein B1A98_05670 [Bacillus badius]TDW05118.1 morphogenetic protein associated with SpoVID [Bacillus badius]
MRIHIVQKGDTLWTIAKKYGVNFDELKKLNAQLSNPDLIMPGMKIKVPTPAVTPKKEMPKPPKEMPNAPKEMPKPPKEMPKPVQEAPPAPPPKPVKEQPKPVPPMKEQPKPPLPPVIPEVEINQIFQMNMEQMQQTVQPPAPSPPPSPPVKPDNIFPGLDKKEEAIESENIPIAPPPMPKIEMAPPAQGGKEYPMNAYVNQSQMAPAMHGYHAYPGFHPHWCMPMPIHAAPSMPPSYEMVEGMMESSSEEVSSHYPMMHYPSSDHVQGMHGGMPNIMPNMPNMPNMPMPNAPIANMPNMPMPNEPMPNMPNMPMPNEPMPNMPNMPMPNEPMPNMPNMPMMNAPIAHTPAMYAPAMYPSMAPCPMPYYPQPSCCVPMTPVMPAAGYMPSMEYGMESAEYGAYPQVMGAYQPPAAYPMPVMHQPYMQGYHPSSMMYPAGGMAMPNQFPSQTMPGKSDCGCQRTDEENEE